MTKDGLESRTQTSKECAWKQCAISQRETELKLYNTDQGCLTYKLTGCYYCNGKNKTCNTYTEPKQ